VTRSSINSAHSEGCNGVMADRYETRLACDPVVQRVGVDAIHNASADAIAMPGVRCAVVVLIRATPPCHR
jgi:hypothetical protein